MVKDLGKGFITVKHAIFFTKFEPKGEEYVEAFIPDMKYTITGKTKKEIIEKINASSPTKKWRYSETW